MGQEQDTVVIDRAGMMERLAEAFQAMAEGDDLIVALRETIHGLLGENEDVPLRQAILAQVARFFSVSPRLDRSERTGFCLQVVRTILSQRPDISALRLSIHDRIVREMKRLDDLPWHLRPLNPTSILAPPMPPPEKAPDFERLFPAAVEWRIRSVLEFFHRRNPTICRELPVPDLLTPEFCTALVAGIRTLMIPAFMKDRRVRHIAALARWDEVDTAEFWEVLRRSGESDRLMLTWNSAWATLTPDKPVRGSSRPPEIPAALAALRRLLGRPDFGPLEIQLCTTLLGPVFSRTDLERAWTRARQLYEQEMDRRSYQDKAREGALRDSLLELLESLPDRHGELMVMLCYWNFPRLTVRFLAAFSRNKGSTPEERRARVPLLMAFLDNPAATAVLGVEDGRMDEERRAIEAAREQEKEQRRRDSPNNSLRWDSEAPIDANFNRATGGLGRAAAKDKARDPDAPHPPGSVAW